jgi:hypothetical protein
MTLKTFKRLDTVRVYTWTAPRKFIGEGKINEVIPWVKGYDGPVACIVIPGHSGRYLRDGGDAMDVVS